MTEAKQKRLYVEVAADMYYKGALSICDILQSSLADMPDQDAKISVREFLVAVAMARHAVQVKSREIGVEVGRS